MALKIIGELGYEADVGPDKALFVENRPAAGIATYGITIQTGSIAATLAADSTLFSFLWTHPTNLCVLRYITVSGVVIATITTGVHLAVAAYFARSFTAADTGGTAFNIFSPDNQKMRRDTPASLVGDLRAASTGTLTPGSRTLDTDPLGRVSGWTGTVVGTRIFKERGAIELVNRTDYGQHPIVLAKNEGIVIRNPTAGPASGTFALTAQFEWRETQAY